MSISKLKKSRMSFDKITQKVKEDSSNKSGGDSRFYYPQLDENKNGQAVIRFLQPAEGEDMPWVKVFSHGFNGPGGWYIEECPTTINNDCPACKANSEIVSSHGGWDSTPETDKNLVRKRKRRLQYVANILVVEDKKNPELEGKVMLFKFGAKIFDKIKSALQPEFDDEVAMNPFDFWEGANFHLRIRKFEGNVNYDKSSFAKASEIASTDKAIEEIWNQQYKLTEFVSTDRFKAYDELQKELERALGARKAPTKRAADMADEANEKVSSTSPKTESQPEAPTAPETDSQTEDAMDFFRKMADQ